MSPLEAERDKAVNRVLSALEGKDKPKKGQSKVANQKISRTVRSKRPLSEKARIKASAKTLPWAHLHHVPRNYIAMGRSFYVIVGREGYYREAKREEFINVISCFSLEDFRVINLIQFSTREIDDYLFEIAKYDEEHPF